MKRRKEEQIGAVLLRYLRQMQLETPLNEYRLIQAWDVIAGSTAARYTQDLKIYNQQLHVRLRSAVLRTELLMRRSDLVRQLNAYVGADVITDISFS